MTGKAGRPVGGSDARGRLIVAARQLFVALPYAKVSTRMVASRAEVNVALIRYYFGNKGGLFETMLRESIAPIQAEMQKAVTVGGVKSIGDVMRTYYRIMSPNPDLPKLIVRAMMMAPGDVQREAIEGVFRDIVPLAQSLMLEQMRERGMLRTEIEPEMAKMTIISMMVFPFLAPPSLLGLHGITLDEDWLNALADHNVAVLTGGMMVQPDARPEPMPGSEPTLKTSA
ncbi:TetR/AcrR family transcriptional regulator [Photobacterium atrarenae]|uniref:TetR/AcrR family transcriptional regulator n=1 Tax=Photobacterium atrarenae TaxID=865757 RepID=A0ABY5GDV3_9GAMM|nr:TetR/AcrR family transcriptional regulator [Photobacterium atrarenae]UTV27427.1 TetR/AcrR family transcriptional regulator [Photobacterium atrarenae]